MLAFSHNLDEFNRTLERYARVSSKTVREAVRKKAQDVALWLSGHPPGWTSGETRREGFGPPVQAEPERIEREAQARGWLLRRRPNELTPVDERLGVSQTAARIARDMMEGQPSQLFRVGVSGHLEPVRFGKAGARRGKVLISKKGWRRGGVGIRGVAERDLETAVGHAEAGLESGEFKRLNVKAVANMLEIMFRKRAAKGGTLASQWLTRGYKGQGYRARTFKGGFVAGGVVLEKDSVTIQGNVPGVALFPHVIAKVLRDATKDMDVYIARKLAEVIK